MYTSGCFLIWACIMGPESRDLVQWWIMRKKYELWISELQTFEVFHPHGDAFCEMYLRLPNIKEKKISLSEIFCVKVKWITWEENSVSEVLSQTSQQSRVDFVHSSPLRNCAKKQLQEL
jgi:hypothetical protein